jgi:peroxiredoxin
MDTLISIGQRAPLFELPDLQGSLHKLESLRGKVVILNFWSAECPWSKAADQELLSYISDLDAGLTLWSIASNANEPIDLLQHVAAERALPLVVHDKHQTAADLYGALTTPHFFVVDREGVLRYQGALNDVTFRQREPTRNYLRPAVEALLSGMEPDPSETTPYGCTIVRYNADH